MLVIMAIAGTVVTTPSLRYFLSRGPLKNQAGTHGAGRITAL